MGNREGAKLMWGKTDLESGETEFIFIAGQGKVDVGLRVHGVANTPNPFLSKCWGGAGAVISTHIPRKKETSRSKDKPETKHNHFS